ncbi:MAG: hypothetical protein C4547_01950 [Phycisphaerales bacterium]|nr:MAG: hypothetical protein C4547_01950 [Phycisphaerales bacterium]
MSNPTVRLPILLCAALVLSWPAVPGRAAYESPGRAADEPPERADADAGKLQEKTVYIPYDRLREIFEREGRGVYLPYEEFQELWRAAAAAKRPPPETSPPVEALVSQILSEATVSRDVVQVRATVSIDLLTDGWHEIPLRLADAAVTSAVLDDRPARLVSDRAGGHRLLIEKRPGDPERIELSLEYAKAFTRSPGRNSVSFDAPQAPINRWQVRIPETGVKIDIHPMIAATQAPAEGAEGTPEEGTAVLAFVGAAPSVQIDWTLPAEGATGLKALIGVQTVQRVWIHEGVVRTQAQLTYDIRRGAVDRLSLEAPADQKVVSVYDANVRQWSVEPAGDVQLISVELFEPSQATQEVSVELERFIDFSTGQTLTAPVVRALDAGRQQGLVGVGVAEGLRAEPVRWTGLMQIDAAEMPKPSGAGAAAGPWALSFRFASVPFDLALKVEKIEPRITVDALAEVRLEPHGITGEFQAIFTIEKAGIFSLEFELPAGYTLSGVRGISAQGVTPVVVESRQVSAGDPPRLTVNLSRRAIGRAGCAVSLFRALDEADLRTPTGRSIDVPIAIPRVVDSRLERTSGRLIVGTPESLRASPMNASGLRTIPAAEALAERTAAPTKEVAEGSLTYSFADEPVALTLRVERRKPYVTARQFLFARIEPGVVKYDASFLYDIRYSDVESLRIDVPSDLVGRIQCDTKGVRESVIEPAPNDLAQGFTALRLRHDARFARNAVVKFSWETKLESLDVGESRDFAIPRLKAMEVDRAWGQIALAKAETIDVRPAGGPEAAATGLRPIDPRHDLMDGIASIAADAARAFEFHQDWSLVVTATRYKLEEVKRTSIERALLRMVVTRGGQVSVQALYRLRSAHQRLALKMPGGVEFDTDPVRINGRPVSLERGQADEYFVPLGGQDPDVPFLLEVRYTQPRGGTRFSPPVFPSEPAVQKVCVTAYLPPERVFLGSMGPWTDELRWEWRYWRGFVPRPMTYDPLLLGWVSEGVSLPAGPSDSFQVDGLPFAFSALQPPAPPEGTLSLVTMDEDWWNGLVLGALLIGGLLLLRAGGGARFLAVGAFLTAGILCGVFLPTLSLQLFDPVTGCAILVVLVVWLVHYLVRVRPHDPVLLARRQAREETRLARIRAGTRQPAVATPTPEQQKGGPQDE